MRSWIVAGLAAAGLMAATGDRGAQAQEALADFYRGKTVSLLVGYPPGGGYDVYARLMQRYMPKYLPGNPAVVVRNVPGAASLTLVNQLYSVEARDGTVFGLFARSVAMDRLMGRQGTNFDPVKLGWVGSANNEVSICTVRGDVGVKSVDDFMSRPITFGANAPGSESDMYPTILNNLLGAKFKVVTGYPAASDLMMAIERGETQGRCGWTISAAKSTHADWLRDGKLFVAVQFATDKHPELPNVPLVTDMAKTDEQKQALQLLLSMQTMGRPFAAPPGLPADRLTALRRAFDATMADAEFRAEADKQQLEIQPVTGEKLQTIVEAMFAAPAPIVEAARKAVSH